MPNDSAPRKVRKIQLVKIQSIQSLASSMVQTIMLRKVTSAIKLMELGDNTGCNENEGSESRNGNDIEVDTVVVVEDSINDNDKARYHSLYRDLRPRHVLKWIVRKLGRSFVFLLRYVGTSRQRRELTEDAKEVGLVDSTQSMGKPYTRGSDQQYRNWYGDCCANTTEVGITCNIN